jgi:hypothetical protein
MRLHVVFNDNGDIVAAARLSGDAPVRARPVADEQAGHRAAETIGPPSTGTTIWPPSARGCEWTRAESSPT